MSPSCRPSPVAACLSPLRCGQTVCSGRRCTAPPCASRGGRTAREGAAPRAICLFCHGARAGQWAHWSIGPWIAAVRAGGRARAWAVITGRVREPRAPGRFPHTQSPVQTAQQPHGATFVTRHACGAGPALRRKEVVDRSHDWPSQPHASIGSHRGRLRRPGAALEGPQTRRRHIVRVAQSPTRPAAQNKNRSLKPAFSCKIKTNRSPPLSVPLFLKPPLCRFRFAFVLLSFCFCFAFVLLSFCFRSGRCRDGEFSFS